LDVLFGVAGEDYCLYLADERELAAARDLPDGDLVERGAGQPIRGQVRLKLPEGEYQAACFDPQTGQYSPAVSLRAGAEGVALALPEFVHDLVVRVKRA
jgi:hypothetical protein